MADAEKCVCCGAVIPEGSQYCPNCKVAVVEDMVDVVRCKICKHGSHVDTPEGRVWCEKMCRYMVFEGYCSYGKRRSNGKQT